MLLTPSRISRKIESQYLLTSVIDDEEEKRLNVTFRRGDLGHYKLSSRFLHQEHYRGYAEWQDSRSILVVSIRILVILSG